MAGFDVTTTVNITPQQIADLVTTYIEGYPGPFKLIRKSGDWSEASTYEGEFALLFEDEEDEDQRHELNRETVQRGLQLMAENYGFHWDNLVSDNADFDTADSFLQLALLGEITYG